MSETKISAIRVEGLCKSFGELEVLKDVSIEIEKGEIVSIIGGSGCGKSVFLRLVEMLEKPDSGKVFINGEEMTAKGANIDRIRRNVGMVYQGFFLFEHLNVMDNMCLAPVKLLKMQRKDAEAKAMELLDMVGLTSKAKAMPKTLSGGQKQRIAIVRALMMDPEILLFDEPTSALDPTMVGEVLATMRMLAKRGLTMVIVTHEFKFARDVSTRVLYFAEKGIYDQGTPQEIFDNPKKELTVAFIRKIKSISEHIGSTDFDLMSFHGRIYVFGERYGYTQRECQKIQLCSEELIYEYIRVANPEWERNRSEAQPVDIDILIEYSETENRLIIECDATSREYDIFSCVEDLDPEHLGVTIIKHNAAKYSWEYANGRNRVRVEMLGA